MAFDSGDPDGDTCSASGAAVAPCTDDSVVASELLVVVVGVGDPSVVLAVAESVGRGPHPSWGNSQDQFERMKTRVDVEGYPVPLHYQSRYCDHRSKVTWIHLKES